MFLAVPREGERLRSAQREIGLRQRVRVKLFDLLMAAAPCGVNVLLAVTLTSFALRSR
jgi:hypothetical protein